MDLYFSNFYELIELSNSYDYYFNCTSIGDIRDIREKRMKSELACMSIWFYYHLFFYNFLCYYSALSCLVVMLPFVKISNATLLHTVISTFSFWKILIQENFIFPVPSHTYNSNHSTRLIKAQLILAQCWIGYFL